MTVHVDQEELIKIAEGTIFYRIRFQNQWSERLYPNPQAETIMIAIEYHTILYAEVYKFDGETKKLAGTCKQFDFLIPGTEVKFVLTGTEK